MMNKLKILIYISLIIEICFLSLGIGTAQQTGDALTPITVELKISKYPVLNESADLSCKIMSIEDAPNTTATITLPDGVNLLRGNTSGVWDLKTYVPIYLNASVKFAKTGDFKIEARAYHVVDKKNSWGDLKTIYLTIGETRSELTPGPAFWSTAAQIQPGNATVVKGTAKSISVNVSLPANMLPVRELSRIALTKNLNKHFNSSIDNSGINNFTSALGSPGTLTVTGHWQYWTQLSNYRPVPDTYDWARNFYVSVVDASDSSVLGSGYTNSSGYFSIPVTNPGSNGFKVLLYAYSQRIGLSTSELRVVSDAAGGLTGLSYVWNWPTNTMTAPDGTTDIGTWSPPANYEACWLLSDLNQAWDYAWNHTTGDAGSGTIVWYPTSTDGTYYTTGGQIHLAGEDAKSADTSIREYGKNIMYNNYNAFPVTNCPSPQYMQKTEDVNCAWTEGWADFWALAVTGNSTYCWPSRAWLRS